MEPMTVTVGHGGGHWEIHRGDKIVADFVSTQANAHLFAAAPELLAALKAMLDAQICRDGGKDCALCDAAIAAIAKAEGRAK